MGCLDEDGPKALVQLPTPVNRFPDFVRHVVTSLKSICPMLGSQRIANLLARAGLHATPDEIYRGLPPAHLGPRFETRRKYSARRSKLRARKGTHLELVLAHVDGKAHLPIVNLRAA